LALIYRTITLNAMLSQLFVKRLTSTAVLPIRHNEDDAGYDISSDCPVSIPPKGKCLVGTGISFTVPKGTYGQIAPRSSLSMKSIFVNAGVIDRGYTGEVKVLLFNMGDESIELPEGSRIAQLIIKKIAFPLVEDVESLEASDRGEGSFGSTGV
jgi:dUTP pyrophosphatase